MATNPAVIDSSLIYLEKPQTIQYRRGKTITIPLVYHQHQIVFLKVQTQD